MRPEQTEPTNLRVRQHRSEYWYSLTGRKGNKNAR